MERGGIPEAEGDDEVEFAAGFGDAAKQARADRPLNVEPRELVVERMESMEDAGRVPSEFQEVARPFT